MLPLHRATIAFLLLVVTTRADLLHRVIEMKNALQGELQSLLDIIPGYHHIEHKRSAEIHDILNEFLAQNQQSIGAILRVLKLIDHDVENVIHDCVRVFDLDSLQSTNPIFRQVTKPLLLQVRDLCELITDSSRIDEIEPRLERVEREATVYRERMDQALKDVAVIFGLLDQQNHYEIWIQRKKAQIEAQLESLNRTMPADLDGHFNKHFPTWIGKYKKFLELLPTDFSYDSQEYPEIALLDDFLDYLDNETTVLQGELEDFLDDWMLMVMESIEIMTYGSKIYIDYFLDFPLEMLTNGTASLKCAAEFYETLDEPMMIMLQKVFQCVDFEDDMRLAFNQIVPVLDSADKAISSLMDSYLSCAKMAALFGDVFILSDCLDQPQESIHKTGEFVEKKATEVFYHVEDAMMFNAVQMEICLQKELRETAVQLGGGIRDFGGCY